MQQTEIEKHLENQVQACMDSELQTWLQEKIAKILAEKSAREFYLTYSLLAGKITPKPVEIQDTSELSNYLKNQQANCLEIARITLLRAVLKVDEAGFAAHVSKIIQVADTSELATFLKYLTFLPHPEQFKMAAVDALRTNVATVFDALALYNPYPAQFFNDAQWNQMYLKAAFMQRPLHLIPQVEQRANKDLARIISDYAHERWAAGRDINPYFWRPVAPFLNDSLIEDMKHLLQSSNNTEQKAAALCCYYSTNERAEALLDDYPQLKEQIKNNNLNWNTIEN